MRMRGVALIILLLFIYPCIAQDCSNQVYLSSPIGGAYRSTFDNVSYNTSSKMEMGNEIYSEGTQLCSDFISCPNKYDAYFNLNRSYDRLTGLIGIDDKSSFNWPPYRVILTFLGDDKELQKITMAPGDLPANVDLNVSGVRRLNLDAISGNPVEFYANVCIDFVNAVLC